MTERQEPVDDVTPLIADGPDTRAPRDAEANGSDRTAALVPDTSDGAHGTTSADIVTELIKVSPELAALVTARAEGKRALEIEQVRASAKEAEVVRFVVELRRRS